MSSLTLEQEGAALEFDPFEGDFGDQSDRVLSNKFVNVRKPGACSHCGFANVPAACPPSLMAS